MKAKGRSIQNSLTEIKGTLIYLPSEIVSVIEDEALIHPSCSQDIWGLGIIAHQIFADNKHPFQAPNFLDFRRNIEDGVYKIDQQIPINSQIYQIIEGIHF